MEADQTSNFRNSNIYKLLFETVCFYIYILQKSSFISCFQALQISFHFFCRASWSKMHKNIITKIIIVVTKICSIFTKLHLKKDRVVQTFKFFGDFLPYFSSKKTWLNFGQCNLNVITSGLFLTLGCIT